jgi:pyruvate/2-oxoglutarate dehydrogenase complex dihydrolipoamide acyltransferase (E2) component
MTGNIEIRFPEDQQEGTEATVTNWLVKEGDSVAAHAPVVEIETDKVVVEVAAPQSGKIADIRIQQDEEVNPGDVLCTLIIDAGTADEAQAATPTESPVSDDSGMILIPAVSRVPAAAAESPCRMSKP